MITIVTYNDLSAFLMQLKILVNFVQILSLTLWTKVNWNCEKCDEHSSLTIYTVDALNVVNLNFEIFHFGELLCVQS